MEIIPTDLPPEVFNKALDQIKIAVKQLGIDKYAELCLELNQEECPVYHHFGPGIYIREVKLPKGAFVIGHKQRESHFNSFLSGQVLMINEDGSTAILKAPMQFVSPPGRKIGYIIEDVIWQNIYASDERDVEKLEERFLEKADFWYKSEEKRLAILHKKRLIDIEDFYKISKEFDFTIKRELTDMPIGSFSVSFFPSSIEGRGVYATSNFGKDQYIGPVIVKNKCTPIGLNINHSIEPNTQIKFFNDNASLFSLGNIIGNKGGQSGDELTINYKNSLELFRGSI